MDLFHQIAGTILLRPYFVAFFLAYFFACTLHLGLKRAFLFAIAGYCISWAAEYSSIHNGIPYGLYYYIPTTQGRELWVLGIPFMDSMSFVFLSYASYSLALFALSPAIRVGGIIYLLENNRIRHAMKVRLLGALFCMCLDVIIDPVALQGSKWFLGQIYGYAEKGFYFGIPISNFIGWFVVGFFLIYALQLIDRFLTAKRARDYFHAVCAWRYLVGPALYLSVVVFNLSVTFVIGEYVLFWTGILVVLLPLAMFVLIQRIRLDRAVSDKDIEAHLRDFPEAAIPGKARAIEQTPRHDEC